MGIFDIFKREKTIPVQQTVLNNWLQECVPTGYTSLANSPEVKSAIEKIAEIVSTMTIHLMANTDKGDVRVKNELSKLIDIRPNKQMSKQLFISWVVQEMLLRGNAVALVKTRKGFIDELVPITYHHRTFHDEFNRYWITYKNKNYKDQDILNFRYNPNLDKPWIGQSQQVLLKDLANQLKQTRDTTTSFLTNRITPGLIIKVNALTEELTTESGRDKIESKFLKRAENGQPWIIPGDMIDVTQVKPLTLNDIAIHDTAKLSKELVAAILGVPKFLLGVGEFNKEEYNNFIKTKVAVICKAIESELTEKILISKDMYFSFNKKSLLNYSLNELGDLYSNLFVKGIVTGNEVRDALGMPPLEGLDELILLENYIKLDDISKQNKLKGGEKNEDETIQGNE